jgi:diaminopimelate decarboxylase
MNYKITEAENKINYAVFETQTDQIIKQISDFSEARKFMKHLNLGGGFDGWTPNFLLVDFSKFINKSRKDM